MFAPTIRSCLDFTVKKFKNELFCFFEALFGIFALSILANRPLFTANREYKSTQKVLSTKLEIQSKQLLTRNERIISQHDGTDKTDSRIATLACYLRRSAQAEQVQESVSSVKSVDK